tara:strand:- start:1112 stop:2854 length:1743 start_codon:yes stop_codon:yes gene_type:complete
MSTFLKGRELSELEAAALEVLVKNIAPNPEEYRVDEAVHPMGVHVTSVSGKKVEGLPAYKVTKIGSKVKEHGGITVGEHLHDNHLDDLADMGHKIKNEQVTTEANSRMFKAKGQYSTGEPNPISNNGDTVSGPQDQLQKKAEGKMNLIQASVKEISQRAKSNGTQKESKEVTEDMHKKKKKHDCASKVKSEEYGIGYCIPEQHTMLEDGTVTHYDVEFDDVIIQNFPVTELEIIEESSHMHEDNEEKNSQLEGAMKNMVTNKMTSGKGMSYDKAVKAAEKDLKQGKNIPKTSLATQQSEAAHKGVEVQQIPMNQKHTAKMKKASKMYKSVPASQRGTGSAGKRGGDSGFSNVKMEDMHDSEEGMSKDAKKKVAKGKSNYKGLDNAKGDDDKDAVAEGALGTGLGAVGGAAIGGPVGAAVGGVAGHMAQQGLRKLGKKIKSGIAGFRKPQTAESMNKMKEDTDVDYTVIEHNAFDIEIPEELLFADYLNAASTFTENHSDAVKIADQFFGENDESIIFEAFTRKDIEDRISAHAKAGKAVSMPKYGMKDGKPTAEYTVTDKDAGSKTTFMHHGNIRRVTRN